MSRTTMAIVTPKDADLYRVARSLIPKILAHWRNYRGRVKEKETCDLGSVISAVNACIDGAIEGVEMCKNLGRDERNIVITHIVSTIVYECSDWDGLFVAGSSVVILFPVAEQRGLLEEQGD